MIKKPDRSYIANLCSLFLWVYRRTIITSTVSILCL